MVRRLTKAAGTSLTAVQNQEIVVRPTTGAAIQAVKKTVVIQGDKFTLDYEALIRMVRQVTQTIGEYRGQDNAYAAYIVNALRKARADMVSDLEHHFGVHWKIDESSGKSVFYL